jgi:hypothetical protein
MKLTQAEAHSALWTKIKEHLESRIDSHRRKNDHDIDLIQTTRNRGRIAECMYLLEMATPEPTPVAENGE